MTSNTIKIINILKVLNERKKIPNLKSIYEVNESIVHFNEEILYYNYKNNTSDNDSYYYNDISQLSKSSRNSN